MHPSPCSPEQLCIYVRGMGSECTARPRPPLQTLSCPVRVSGSPRLSGAVVYLCKRHVGVAVMGLKSQVPQLFLTTTSKSVSTDLP